MSTIKYNKLIRDKIPEIIEKSGKQAIVERVEGDQLLELLNKKLLEELEEYNESGEIEELADLVEVVQAILEYKEISIGEFDYIRKKKKIARGGFKEGLLLLEVREE
mgnify:CR=1 FL=1